MNNLFFEKTSIAYYSLYTICAIVFYFIIVFDSINKYNPINFFIYVLSFIIILGSIYSIKKSNIKSYNIFLFSFFLALFLNTFNLSSKQLEKEVVDIYYYFVGSLFVGIILYLFEHIRVKTVYFKNFVSFDINSVYIVLIILFVLTKFYIAYNVGGFRIFNYDQFDFGDKYVVPGFSGASVILQWSLLIFLPYVKKKYAILAVLLIVILSGILNVRRGDIVRVFIFLIIYYIFIKIHFKQLNLKFLFNVFLIIIFTSIIFTIFGEYRLDARGVENGSIIEFLGSRINSTLFSWIYGYLTFNFEVIKFYYELGPLYEFTTFKDLIFSVEEEKYIDIGISGFNATTFLKNYIIDFGYLYFYGLFFYSFIVGLIILFSRKINFFGMKIFIFSMLFFNLFGDHIMHRSIFMSIIFCFILFPFIRFRKNI